MLLIAEHPHKSGQLSAARENLQLAACGIRSNVPLRYNGEIFHTLVRRQAEIGDLAGALTTAKQITDDIDLVRAMVEASIGHVKSTDDLASAAVVKALTDAYTEVIKIDGRRSEVGQTLIAIGRAQANAKDAVGARKTFNFARISFLSAEFKERDDTLAALAAAQVLSGDRVQAMNIVRAIEEEARSSMALASVARALSEISDVDAARPLFRLAFEDAVKTVNEKSWNEIPQHILVEQTRAGLFNDAFTTAGSIKIREIQSRSLLAMSNVLIEADLYDEAIKLVEFIPYISMRAQIFVTLALVTGHAGDPLEASTLLARAVEPTGAPIFQDELHPVLIRIIDAQVAIGAPQTTRALFLRVRELVNALPSIPDRVNLLT
jgi:tetratricopeptide (TPR) repeat protein